MTECDYHTQSTSRRGPDWGDIEKKKLSKGGGVGGEAWKECLYNCDLNRLHTMRRDIKPTDI